MRIPRFEYIEPVTVAEACAALADHQGKAKVVAGGTDLLVLMKQRVTTPQYLVNIARIKDLDYITYSRKDGLKLGALARLNAIAAHRDVLRHFTALAQAAAAVASPNLRNLATIGGNLCLDARCWYYNQSPLFRQGRVACFKRGGDRCYVVKKAKVCQALCAADTAAALVALQAEAEVVSRGGRRVVPLAEFFTGQGQPVNILGPTEIVTEVRLPALPANTASAFVKCGFRGCFDFAVASAAAVVTLARGDGVCQDARIALSAVTSAPVNAGKAAAALKGKRVDEALAREAAAVAVTEVRPVSSIWTSVYHRRHVIAANVKQAILQAAGEGSKP